MSCVGYRHAHYAIGYLVTNVSPASFFHLDPWLLAKVIIASAAFGLASTGFASAKDRESDTL